MMKVRFIFVVLAAAFLAACSNPASSSTTITNTTTLTAASFAGTYVNAAYDNMSMNPPYKIVIDSTGMVWTTYDKSTGSSSANPTINLPGVYAGNSNWYQFLVGAQYWVINLSGSTLSVRYVNYTGGSFANAYASTTTYTYTKQ